MTPALDTMRQDNKTSVSDLMPARSLVRDNEIMRNTLSSTGEGGMRRARSCAVSTRPAEAEF